MIVFRCSQCQYSCSDHNSLRRHKMRHTGHKPYKCPHCPYSCIQAISLKSHIKIKHPGQGGVFCCNLCLYRTINETQYNNHLKDHENGLIETEVVTEIDDQTGEPVVKCGPRQRKPSRGPGSRRLLLNDMPGTQGLFQVLQPPLVQGFVQIPVPRNTNEQVHHLQIQMNENGENVISAEDYAKLASYENLSQTDVATANLIYSALSAISLQTNNGTADSISPQDLVARVENGDIQTSIETNSTKEGVTTHTVSFHLPNNGDLIGGVTLQEGIEEKDAVTVLQVANTETEWQIAGNEISENGTQLYKVTTA